MFSSLPTGYEITAILFLSLFGLAFGSFANVLIFRLEKEEGIRGRSHCPHCRKALRVIDLIPVLSFVFLRGCCRQCSKPISLQYPLVELLCGILFVLAAYLGQQSALLLIAHLILFYGLLLAAIFDLRNQTIPDLFTGVVFLGAFTIAIAENDFSSAGLGAFIGGFWFLWQWLVSRGRFVGSGDILLAASLGLWLGWRDTIVMLVLAYIIGALAGGYLLMTKRASRKSTLAFGPFLAIGAIVAALGAGDWYVERMLG